MRSILPRKNSLAVPIVGLLLAVAAGMLLIGYVINDRVFSSAIEEREADRANSIRFATRSIIEAEVRKLATLSGLLKTDSRLAAALLHHRRSGGDTGLLKATMDDLFWRIDTQVFVMLDAKGVVLYRANEPLRKGDTHRVWGFEEAAAGADILSASEGPHGWAIRALAPVKAENRIVGILILGTRLDEAFASRISRETGAEVSLATLNGVLSSSNHRGSLPPDPARIRECLLEQRTIFRMDLDGYQAVQYAPIQVVDETFCMVIRTQLSVVHGMLHRNRGRLVRLGAALLAGVLLLGIVSTVLIVRPLKRLESETRQVVRDFTGEEIPEERKGNEIAILSSAFRRMVEAIRSHIAAREKAEADLRRSGEQLRQAQKMEAVGRLAGGVAHDFNNLLTVINGYSESLLQRFGSADPAHRDLREIRDAGERAAALTRQLLAFSRRQIMELQPVRLNEIVSNLGAMLRRVIGEDIELSTTLSAGLWTVTADPHQMEQVLMNLAVNARDAMPSGGRITLSTANVQIERDEDRDGDVIPAGKYVRLAISDTGCGMDAQTKARIFEPFFTTKKPGKGTGLGLAMVHGIVLQTGGRIRVESEVGKGTTFEILLPADEARMNRKETGGIASRPSPEVRGGETILVVEDEPSVREILLLSLTRSGYATLSAKNGIEALEVASRHRGTIDMLLTDLVMPGMGGIDLAQRLAALRPEMKLLFLSGHSEEAVGRIHERFAGSTFLQKPVTTSLLAKTVREAFDATRPDAHPVPIA